MNPKRNIPARIRSDSTHLRDSRLIVIAAEGQKTESKYFEGLSSYYHNSRIKVHIIERLDTNSSPTNVLKMLDGFKKQYLLKEDDSPWLVCDVDRWGQEKLSEIAQLCTQKGYGFAVSNPAFEIWLLLHLKDMDEYSIEEQQELFKNGKDGTNRTRLERELMHLMGEYNKSKPLIQRFLPLVGQAAEQARRLDTNPDQRWTNGLGSRVYLLIERIRGH
jgi:hypothetical protein